MFLGRNGEEKDENDVERMNEGKIKNYRCFGFWWHPESGQLGMSGEFLPKKGARNLE